MPYITATSVKQHTSELKRPRHKNNFYREAIQISLQTIEAALDLRFDHFIVIILASGKRLQ